MSAQQLIADFIAKWGPGGASFALNEEQGAQQHFIELCTVLGVPTPAGGDDYLFEKGMLTLGQPRGYAVSSSAATSRGKTRPPASRSKAR